MWQTTFKFIGMLSCLIAFAVVLVFSTGCRQETSIESASTNGEDSEPKVETKTAPRRLAFKQKLSEYGLYTNVMHQLKPAQGIIEYELNSTLFSDYAEKQRLVKLPQGTSITYQPTGILDFPVGTVIAKTFYYSLDPANAPDKIRIIETRILEHRESGWVGIPYVWDDEQSDAFLSLAGANKSISRIDGSARIEHEYSVPNFNDCKRCHVGDSTEPIGPKARNLNRTVEFNGNKANQLVSWVETGNLKECPAPDQVPKLAAWDNESESLDARARAYLEINCAHCHSAKGSARNSGLHLNVAETNPYRLGVNKSPVAAGQGTGGRLYGIVPGKPDESILEHRMRSLLPGEVMPEFGKALVHREGLQLIRDWISEMKISD